MAALCPSASSTVSHSSVEVRSVTTGRRRPLASGGPGSTSARSTDVSRLLGKPLSDRQAHRVFNALRDQLGWVNRGGHAAIRLHDLRHTFVVCRLMRWHADGTDIDQMMLALSTYMGHAEIFYTYWYLTAVPELMALAGGKFERFADLAGGDDEYASQTATVVSCSGASLLR